MSTWTICGYDSCIHLCEETIEGDVAAPWAMVLSVGGAGVLGLFFVISMLFCVQSVDNLFDPESVTGGAGIPQVCAPGTALHVVQAASPFPLTAAERAAAAADRVHARPCTNVRS